MVTKVVTEHDVDNVTIIINPQNKLEAKIPTTSNEVVIEEVTGITNFSDSKGNYADAPFSINKGGQQYPITKVGRIVGTNWLVFQTDAPLVADEPVTPVQPEPEQPPAVDTDWTANVICEQNQDNPTYDETFTGVRLGGNLPEGIITVEITKANSQIQSFTYSGTDYKYNVDPRNVNLNKEYPVKVTLVTDQGNVSKDVYYTCTFISLPE